MLESTRSFAAEADSAAADQHASPEEVLARELAKSHAVADYPGDSHWLFQALRKQKVLLKRGHQHFAGLPPGDPGFSYGAEWLLDNSHLVQVVLRQIKKDLPEGYYHQLPKLSTTKMAGRPRIYAVAAEILRVSRGLVQMDGLSRFIRAYQDISPLTMGEVWALPIMLRAAILEVLTAGVRRLMAGPGDKTTAVPFISEEAISPDDLVANSIISLRLLSIQEWEAFFEDVSLLEAVLRRDPADVYARMDFKTRDAYRKAVEEIAREADTTETEVAEQALELARQHSQVQANSQEVSAHVGYFLLGQGRKLLRKQVEYRPGFLKRVRHLCLRHPELIYLGGVGLLSLAGLALVLKVTPDPWGWTLLPLLLLLPVPLLTMATSLMNWLVSLTVEPSLLPRMDYSRDIPDSARTMVVVPSMLTDTVEIEHLARQIELHFLGNEHPNISFAILADLADSVQELSEDDDQLIRFASNQVTALNDKYGPLEGNRSRFYLFVRRRQWNEREGIWMGWERKRGKIEEFNRLLLHQGQTSFTVVLGQEEELPTFRYVITLDADTDLPRESAAQLIGTLDHPLNQAVFDARTGRVTAGYTILQPRTEVKPAQANESLFTRIYAGDSGLDLYTRAVSDVYQDLFGEGIYVGKGIYDIASFDRSLSQKVPENSLLSHDLFEGVHGRVGLITDVVLFEEYPPGVLTHARRQHRWVRGDWQLLPWLLPRLFTSRKNQVQALPAIHRWKIFDNLRRSLLPPCLLLLLVFGWLLLPGSALFWTFLALFIPAIPLLTATGEQVVRKMVQNGWDNALPGLKIQIMHWAAEIAFLPYRCQVMLHAVLVTLHRLFVSRRHLLQWTSSAHTARMLSREQKRSALWLTMLVAPAAALLVFMLLLLFRPASLAWAFPILLLWFLAPEAAWRIDQPEIRSAAMTTASQRYRLFWLARRTWLFYEQFITPEDHWLPPDHFQESPRGLVAHRTSPTNIGLGLLSTLGAYDLGYIGALGLGIRLRNTFEALGRLEQYRGHFLNWYDTRSLAPLPPRYVSTVDSGNLAGCLIALRQGCLGLPEDQVLRWQAWQGLLDSLSVLGEHLSSITLVKRKRIQGLKDQLDSIRDQILNVQHVPDAWFPLVTRMSRKGLPELDNGLMALIEDSGSRISAANLQNLRIWSKRLRHQLHDMQRELEFVMPWLKPMSQPPKETVDALRRVGATDEWEKLNASLLRLPAMREVPEICRNGRLALERIFLALKSSPLPDGDLTAVDDWLEGIKEALDTGERNVSTLLLDYQDLAERAEDLVTNMDFSFLYNASRCIFTIGYNVDSEKLDPNHYDLLASEARIASFIAIAKGEAPLKHWMHLSRPLLRADGMRGLMSWSGTMFEYLMPNLLIRQYPNTLLFQSSYVAVERQKEYSRRKKVPWGVSESGYYGFDAQMNYQYRAFGVPGLGFKRGLGDDLVITPYASLLALSMHPEEVLKNVEQLTELGMLGVYGLYEALDFTSNRLPLGRKQAIVQSFMAHHQGMIFISLINYLHGETMVKRFHADPRIQSVELLLQEQVPYTMPVERTPGENVPALTTKPSRLKALPWDVPLKTPFPLVHYLSNGHYGVLLTNGGGGFSSWQDMQLTRWRSDTTCDNWGLWIYLQDVKSGRFWSAGRQPVGSTDQECGVRFAPHKAEFTCQVHGITSLMEVVVPPEEDVEIRRLTLTNKSGASRRVRVVSYAEVSLAPHGMDTRHQAFNKLFIHAEHLPELNGLLFTRRLRSAEEKSVYLIHLLTGGPRFKPDSTYTCNREQFLGRYRQTNSPQALARGKELANQAGSTLDPVLSISQEVTLPPHASIQLAFVCAVHQGRHEALGLAARYQDWYRIERSFIQAQSHSEHELRALKLSSAGIRLAQQLLSLLFYPHSAMRESSSVLAQNTLGQPGLWSFAISGDYPILLARIENEDELHLVRELVRFHHFWRNRGLMIDLVVLNAKETGYAQEVENQLRRLMVQMKSTAWLNRRGGIFLLKRDQMSDAQYTLICSAARAILDGNRGTVEQQMQSILQQPAPLPYLKPRSAAAAAPSPGELTRPDDLIFDNGLGGFTPDGREYVITPRPGQETREGKGPPAPWINVLANPEFGCILSEASLNCTWSENSGENRLTPWNNDPVSDHPGEAVYFRDEESGRVWTPTLLPAGGNGPHRVRHGQGYTVYEHVSEEIRQWMRIFVVKDAPLKVVQVRVTNTSTRQRKLTATYYAEWVLGTSRETMQQYTILRSDRDNNAVLARNPYNAEFGERVAFAAASRDLHGLTCSRSEFVGRMGSLRKPLALQQLGLGNRVHPGLDPCAALQVYLDLAPGQEEELIFLLGQGRDADHSGQLLREFRDQERISRAWKENVSFWDGFLDTVTVTTPDQAMDLILNRWLPYQNLACRIWGRSALYQSSGAYGFRDQLQDVLALLVSAPDLAREHLLRAAAHQFEAGDVLHWWHPPSGRGVRTRFSDDLLWLPYVTAQYVAVSGDISVLDETVPFRTGEPLQADEEEHYGLYQLTQDEFSLYEHCLRALNRGSTAGAHGLPLMGTGDWNDGMNKVGAEGEGESVWLGWFLLANLKQFIPLCEGRGDVDTSALFNKRARNLEKSLDTHAWDGRWYLRAFYDDGTPLGSAQSEECRIDSIAQSWAVLSGGGSPQRNTQAMEEVVRQLVREKDGLIRLFTPPFDRTEKNPGYIKGYPPGIRENGGQYTHAALWTIWALAEQGEGALAHRLFDLINPIRHAMDGAQLARYRVEPYVVAADVYSMPPHVGRGGWTWYTGSAGWMFRLGMEAILGLRKEGSRLRINPCIPPEWDGYSMTLRLGTATCRIQVQNPDHVSRGVRETTLDGQRIPEGEPVPLPDDGQEHAIKVVLG